MPTLHNIWFVSDAKQDWKRYFLLLIIPTLIHSYFFNHGFSLALLVLTPVLYLSWIIASLGLTVIVWAFISKNYKILPKWSMLSSAILFVVYMISSAPLGKSNSSVATHDLPEPKTIETTVGEKESFSQEREVSPVYEESINGVYSYTEDNFEASITISESSWSGRITIYGSTEYDRGIMNGTDLYDDSGYAKIGYVSNGRIVTSLGGQSVSLDKN